MYLFFFVFFYFVWQRRKHMIIFGDRTHLISNAIILHCVKKRLKEIKIHKWMNCECLISCAPTTTPIVLTTNDKMAFDAFCIAEFWKVNGRAIDPISLRSVKSIDVWTVAHLTSDPTLCRDVLRFHTIANNNNICNHPIFLFVHFSIAFSHGQRSFFHAHEAIDKFVDCDLSLFSPQTIQFMCTKNEGTYLSETELYIHSYFHAIYNSMQPTATSLTM